MLQDLSILKNKVVSDFQSNYKNEEMALPQSFKNDISLIGKDSIRYLESTAVVTTPKGLNIYFPNQWFYIASFFTQYYAELMKYKQIVYRIFPDFDKVKAEQFQKQFWNNVSLPKNSLSDQEQIFLKKFLSDDYRWWNGAKTIDRGDFYVSPILNMANVVNASQSYIADLCVFLSQKPDAVKKLIDYYNSKGLKGNVSYKTFDLPLQTIFYGAPGTGKSHKVKEVTDTLPKSDVFRTTFHPDSDYSTFVGCYKPTTSKGKAESKIYSKEELVNILKQIKESGISYPYHKFAYKYWKSVKSLTTAEKKEVLSEAGSSENYSVEFDKAAILGEEYSNTSSTITYQFVPQAFTKAYCEAWNNYKPEGESEPVFLIIEEINRGNCAQIFGDIFQLLDRKDGFSEYPIDADEDLKKFLMDATKEDGAPWLANKDGIKNGQLCLPPNLHIWATMNTSDQSLFPIDSAFKRRWDWEYVPIKRADKEPEKEWIIKVTHDGKTYWCYWWEFLEAINHQIEETTHSEDKQLGYFFAKPKAGEDFISTDTFVNKVIFYLWNDVFKDEDSAVFQYGNDKVEDVSINRSGVMYFRHFMENKDEMIHYFINQLFAMGKDNTPAVPIDYLKNDDDPKVIEHLPKMRKLEEEAPASEENSDEKSDDADSK